MKRIRLEFDSNQGWREERAKSFGASAIGILFGENHFDTPMTLCDKMRAELNGIFDYEQTYAMLLGHALEPGVAYLFNNKTHIDIIKASAAEYLVRRDDLPFMHASPDRTYWIDPDGKKNDANKGILECKTVGGYEPLKEIPLSWELQLQAQLGILGYKEGYLAWLVKGVPTEDSFGYKRFEFDEQMFNDIVTVVRDFWDRCVMGGETPDPVNAADIVVRYPESVDGKTITADNDTLDIVNKLREYKQTEKELKKLIEETSNDLKMRFTDEEKMIDLNGRTLATFKTKSGMTTIDSKKLKAEYPEAYEACSKHGNPTRTLIIK